MNDALGHRAGDSVLREAALRNSGCLRKADTLVRHGDGEALLRNADAAMYRAKQLGRNNYRFYGR